MALQNFDDEAVLAYLRAAMAAQNEVEEKIALYRDYYDGEQGAVLSDRQKEYLNIDTHDTESFGNVCKRVVQIMSDRLRVESDGISPADPDAAAYADKVTAWWQANYLKGQQGDIYEALMRDGAHAIIVDWDGEKPTFTPNLVYDGATGSVRFHYDTDNNLLFASKRYRVYDATTLQETGITRLTLYYDDRIERYEADSAQPDGWRFLTPAELGGSPNPQPWVDNLGQPLGNPAISFENPPGSELEDVVVVQKMLNHNLGTFDITIDHHIFPHLWARGLSLPIDASTGKAEIPSYGPGMMFLVGDGGEMGRIEPADLERMFRSGVLSWVHLLAIIKGWPYFLFDRAAQPPSGVALQLMEQSLIARVERAQLAIAQSWLKAFDVGRRLHWLYTGEELPGEVNLRWVDARSVDPVADAETMNARFEAGQIPIISRWREMGYTDKQIDQMLADFRRGEEEMINGDFVTGVEQ